MLTRRSVFLLIPTTVLMYGLIPRLIHAASNPSAIKPWLGEDVRRISAQEQTNLSTSLRAFFKQSEGGVVSDALIPGIGSSLYDQFAAVDYGFIMEEYRLPNGRTIFDRYDAHSGVDAIVVPDTSGGIAAAAMLTHFCPKEGVDEVLVSPEQTRYSQHFRCQLDYSLVIYYRHGDIPDQSVNGDLSKWACATIMARRELVPTARKLFLKKIVRVLPD